MSDAEVIERALRELSAFLLGVSEDCRSVPPNSLGQLSPLLASVSARSLGERFARLSREPLSADDAPADLVGLLESLHEVFPKARAQNASADAGGLEFLRRVTDEYLGGLHESLGAALEILKKK